MLGNCLIKRYFTIYGNNIDVDPNCDNPVFVSFRTYVRRVVEGLPEKTLAKEFGDAHESKPDNDINAKAMDLHNNSIGYHLGNQAIINGWSEEELLNQVIDAANNGRLKILK